MIYQAIRNSLRARIIDTRKIPNSTRALGWVIEMPIESRFRSVKIRNTKATTEMSEKR